MLVWDEYKVAHPDGYQYTMFYERHRAWRGRVGVVMRQDHRAGERLFVDYVGQTSRKAAELVCVLEMMEFNRPRRCKLVVLSIGGCNALHRV